MYTIRHFLIFLLVAIVTGKTLLAQDLVARKEIKEFETRVDLFPYESFQLSGSQYFLGHHPMLRLSDGSFALVYPNRKDKFQELRMVRYNLLLEPLWETTFKLEFDEEILEILRTDSLIQLVSHRDGLGSQTAQVVIRKFNLETGALSDPLTLIANTNIAEFVVDISPDSSKLAVFWFENDKSLQKARFTYDYLQTDERIAYQVAWVEEVHFQVYDLNLESLEVGTFSVRTAKDKIWNFALRDCSVDNEGRVFATILKKRTTVEVFRWEKGEVKSLIFDDFIKPHEFVDFFTSELPPLVSNGNAFLAYADRDSKHWNKSTDGFQVICFDFNSGVVDLSRKVPISSTLKVQVEKQREAFGLKPLRNFDQFRIRGFLPMGDTSLWLITQHMEYRDRPSPSQANGPVDDFNRAFKGFNNYRVHEMIWYEFDQRGQIRKAMIVPSFQPIATNEEALGRFTSWWPDMAAGTVQLVGLEASGEELKGPNRIYYRNLDLANETVSERKILYEGRRRNQYVPSAYICWLNPEHVVMMVFDGDSQIPYLVTIRVNNKPEDFDTEKYNSKENWANPDN